MNSEVELSGMLPSPWFPAYGQVLDNSQQYFYTSRGMLEPILEETSEDEENQELWSQYETSWSSESETGSVIRVDLHPEQDCISERDVACPAKRRRQEFGILGDDVRQLRRINTTQSLSRTNNNNNCYNSSNNNLIISTDEPKFRVESVFDTVDCFGGRRFMLDEPMNDIFSDSDSLSYSSLSRSSSLIQFESLEKQLQNSDTQSPSFGSSPSIYSLINSNTTETVLKTNKKPSSANENRLSSGYELPLIAIERSTAIDSDSFSSDEGETSSSNTSDPQLTNSFYHVDVPRHQMVSKQPGTISGTNITTKTGVAVKCKNSTENLSEDSGYCEHFSIFRQKSKSIPCIHVAATTDKFLNANATQLHGHRNNYYIDDEQQFERPRSLENLSTGTGFNDLTTTSDDCCNVDIVTSTKSNKLKNISTPLKIENVSTTTRRQYTNNHTINDDVINNTYNKISCVIPSQSQSQIKKQQIYKKHDPHNKYNKKSKDQHISVQNHTNLVERIYSLSTPELFYLKTIDNNNNNNNNKTFGDHKNNTFHKNKICFACGKQKNLRLQQNKRNSFSGVSNLLIKNSIKCCCSDLDILNINDDIFSIVSSVPDNLNLFSCENTNKAILEENIQFGENLTNNLSQSNSNYNKVKSGIKTGAINSVQNTTNKRTTKNITSSVYSSLKNTNITTSSSGALSSLAPSPIVKQKQNIASSYANLTLLDYSDVNYCDTIMAEYRSIHDRFREERILDEIDSINFDRNLSILNDREANYDPSAIKSTPPPVPPRSISSDTARIMTTEFIRNESNRPDKPPQPPPRKNHVIKPALDPLIKETHSSGPRLTFDLDPTNLVTCYAESLERCTFDPTDSLQSLNKGSSNCSIGVASNDIKYLTPIYSTPIKREFQILSTPNLNTFGGAGRCDRGGISDDHDNYYLESTNPLIHTSMKQISEVNKKQQQSSILNQNGLGSKASLKGVSFYPIVSEISWRDCDAGSYSSQSRSSTECLDYVYEDKYRDVTDVDNEAGVDNDDVEDQKINNTVVENDVDLSHGRFTVTPATPDVQFVLVKKLYTNVNNPIISQTSTSPTVCSVTSDEFISTEQRQQRAVAISLNENDRNKTTVVNSVSKSPIVNESVSDNITPLTQINNNNNYNNKLSGKTVNPALKRKISASGASAISANKNMEVSNKFIPFNGTNEPTSLQMAQQQQTTKSNDMIKNIQESVKNVTKPEAVQQQKKSKGGFLSRLSGFRFSLRAKSKKNDKSAAAINNPSLIDNNTDENNKAAKNSIKRNNNDFIYIPLKGPNASGNSNNPMMGNNKHVIHKSATEMQKINILEENEDIEDNCNESEQERDVNEEVFQLAKTSTPTKVVHPMARLESEHVLISTKPPLPKMPPRVVGVSTKHRTNGGDNSNGHAQQNQQQPQIGAMTTKLRREIDYEPTIGDNNLDGDSTSFSSGIVGSNIFNKCSADYNKRRPQSVERSQFHYGDFYGGYPDIMIGNTGGGTGSGFRHTDKIGLIETNLDTHETIVTGKTRSLIELVDDDSGLRSGRTGHKSGKNYGVKCFGEGQNQDANNDMEDDDDGGTADDEDDSCALRTTTNERVIRMHHRKQKDGSVKGVQRPHKSMEFLLDKENQRIVLPPENELQKSHESGNTLSEHQLRVQASLQRLNVPDWYKQYSGGQPPLQPGQQPSAHQLPPNGQQIILKPDGSYAIRKRNSDIGRWAGLNSKTTSLSSLGSHRSDKSPLMLSPSAHSHHGHTGFSRWSTSHLNSTQTSPSISTRSSFSRGPLNSSINSGHSVVSGTSTGVNNMTANNIRTSFRQPYMGWRSQERLSQPRTPAERLASSLLTNQQNSGKQPTESPEIQSSIKEVTSAIVHYVNDQTSRSSRSRSASPNTRKCWLESSFVGTRPLESPQTPTIDNSYQNRNSGGALNSEGVSGGAISDSARLNGIVSPIPVLNVAPERPSPGSATLEDVLASLLGLPSDAGHQQQSSAAATGVTANDTMTKTRIQGGCGDGSDATLTTTITTGSDGVGEGQTLSRLQVAEQVALRRKSEGDAQRRSNEEAQLRRVSLDSCDSKSPCNEMLKCRYPKCEATTTPSDAKKFYKSCHNCSHMYCSRECRRAHWEKHRKACLHSRVSALCRQVLSSCKDDPDTLRHLSMLARRGFLSQGRGVVRILFRSPESAEAFVKQGFQCIGEASYVRWPDLLPAEMGPELYSELLRLSTEYKPDSKMLIYVAICVVSEAPGNATAAVKWERQLVSRCAKLKLCKSVLTDATSGPPVEQYTDILILTFSGVNKHSLRQRELISTNIQTILKQKGVILRKHYPEVFQRLATYVEGITERFLPVTIHPRDTVTGRAFVCIIMPNNGELDKIRLPASESGSTVRTISVSLENLEHI